MANVRLGACSPVTIDEVLELYQLSEKPEAAEYICHGLNELLHGKGYLVFSDYKYYYGCWEKSWWSGWQGHQVPAWAK